MKNKGEWVVGGIVAVVLLAVLFTMGNAGGQSSFGVADAGATEAANANAVALAGQSDQLAATQSANALAALTAIENDKTNLSLGLAADQAAVTEAQVNATSQTAIANAQAQAALGIAQQQSQAQVQQAQANAQAQIVAANDAKSVQNTKNIFSSIGDFFTGLFV